jgi:hypothetical protein
MNCSGNVWYVSTVMEVTKDGFRPDVVLPADCCRISTAQRLQIETASRPQSLVSVGVGVISGRGQPLEIGPRSAYFAAMDTTQKPVGALTLQLLTWIGTQPRTYADAMEAWRTSCPRMPIWEDAVSEGLIEVNGSGAMRDRKVTLSARGRTLLKHS